MIILASVSPRRRELMGLIAKDFKCVRPECNENLPAGISPRDAVCNLAQRKAASVAVNDEDIVIGADTVVAAGGKILGKPADKAEAADMLRILSGTEHEVYTGVAILGKNINEVFFCKTEVRFKKLTEEEIMSYVATGEPMDKAGAYGIQGSGALFISGISGDYYNVMGLPVCMLNEKIKFYSVKSL